ncbi:retrovirus-related pol polyprotein from transposon TNT 1-94 [Tanacetum coccineum]
MVQTGSCHVNLWSDVVILSQEPLLTHVDQIQRSNYDKDVISSVGSRNSLWGVNTSSQVHRVQSVTLDYDSQMTDKYFAEYTRVEVKYFRDTLLQHMGNVKEVQTRDHVQDKDAQRASSDVGEMIQLSKDETPGVLIDFLTLVQRGLHAQVITVRTDKGTEFINKTLHAYFAKEGIRHETSTARTPEQNGVVERRNRTLVEAARTMLSSTKVPLFFWAEAIATTCFTQNRSLVFP